MELHFTKMEGIGNDYIYVDGIHQEVPMDAEFISRISNRHFGIGGDGMIVILKSDQYDFKMRMFNLDGSEGMMCGNGIRCFAKFCYDHHLTDKKVLNIETKAGLRIVELIFDGDEVIGAKVDMQEPILNCKDIPVIFDQEKMINEKVMIGDQEYALTAVSMGNPHVITYVDSLDFDIETIGEQFEHHHLNLKNDYENKKIICHLDSEKTYRVLENLCQNICKYALEHTRVYLQIIETNQQVIVVFKNISAHEISNPGDLTERFVQGDASRKSEGSGLGLAICKSFVEVQGGTFEVNVDGDLFKTTIIFPKKIEND